MDTRLGYPSEHLAGNNSIEISSPTYATAVGLVMNSSKIKIEKKVDNCEKDDQEKEAPSDSDEIERVTIFDRFAQSLKNFLDNAE